MNMPGYKYSTCDDQIESQSPEHFKISIEHIFAELQRIDALVQTTVTKANLIYNSNDQFHGLYISANDIDRYRTLPLGVPNWIANEDSENLQERKKEIDRLAIESKNLGIELRLVHLQEVFDLTDLDIDILLVSLLSEVDTRYEKIYAYLHDDMSKKQLSVGLLLSLLSQGLASGIRFRDRLNPLSPLVLNMLVEINREPASSAVSFLASSVSIDKRIADYLFGFDEIDSRLSGIVKKYGNEIKYTCIEYLGHYESKLKNIISDNKNQEHSSLILLKSRDYRDRETVIKNICASLGIGLIKVDCGRLVNELQFNQLVRHILREVQLSDVILYWENFSVLLHNDYKDRLVVIQEALADKNFVSIVSADQDWQPDDEGIFFISVELPLPGSREKEEIWRSALEEEKIVINPEESESIIQRFNFSNDQIFGAAKTANSISRWKHDAWGQVDKNTLLEACRIKSGKRIVSFSRKLVPTRNLQDIVLPDDQYSQLSELINAVKNKSLVLEEWGFENKLSIGKSINVMFSGASGTGKTLAAEIIAHELGMDIFKIDLSSVVSKYIGETEKHLSIIFEDARSSNVILFFDEADALFGKRSEVKDAHDRYANIETGYLLQKIEEHDGIVILTSNLRNNIDAAFIRRMHAIVEFPFPDEKHRTRIWQQLFPDQLPLDDSIDYSFLAKQFKLTGGHIKNIGLCAAYLSAAEGQDLGMHHLIIAAKREFQKLNKPCTEADFGCYFELIK